MLKVKKKAPSSSAMPSHTLIADTSTGSCATLRASTPILHYLSTVSSPPRIITTLQPMKPWLDLGPATYWFIT
jgi:hypothetical protein